MLFEIGDRVKYVSYHYGDGSSNPLWGGMCGKVKGTIVKVINSKKGLPYKVKWDNGNYNGYDENDLEIISKIPFKLEEDLFTI